MCRCKHNYWVVHCACSLPPLSSREDSLPLVLNALTDSLTGDCVGNVEDGKMQQITFFNWHLRMSFKTWFGVKQTRACIVPTTPTEVAEKLHSNLSH